MSPVETCLRLWPSLELRPHLSQRSFFSGLVHCRFCEIAPDEGMLGTWPLFGCSSRVLTIAGLVELSVTEETLVLRPCCDSGFGHCMTFSSLVLYIPGSIKLSLMKTCSGFRPSLGLGLCSSHEGFFSISVLCIGYRIVSDLAVTWSGLLPPMALLPEFLYFAGLGDLSPTFYSWRNAWSFGHQWPFAFGPSRQIPLRSCTLQEVWHCP